jgi:hypothetical protein
MSTYQDITLVAGDVTVTLPADMEWTDRRSRNLVAQNVEVSLGGSLIVEEFQQQGGYLVTLVARGNGDTWVAQSVIDQLLALADAPLEAPMTLTYNDGTVVNVRFSYASGVAVDATPVYVSFPQDDSTPYSLTLRLIQASA